LNRLTTRLIFPGQVLYVPDKQGGGARGDERPGTNADDGEGSVVSTPTATHRLDGGTELLEEKGGNLIIVMALTLTWLSIHSSDS
jgi:hypothetical protein